MNTNSPEAFAELPARERILVTAHDLFYRDGIRATGIDKVIAESAVTKVTFYRHFPSKNDLIRAFLEYRHHGWMAWFVEAIARHGGEAGGGLLPLVAVMEEWFRKPIYRGCAFINTVAELGGTLPDVIDICHRHKQDMVLAIRELVTDGVDGDAVAQAAAIAIDGAIIRAQTELQAAEIKQSLLSLALLLNALEVNSAVPQRAAKYNEP